MPSRPKTSAYYRDLFRTLDELSNKRAQITRATDRVLRGAERYMRVEGETSVPWAYIGLIHEMESASNFDRQILNGQRFNRVTTIVPAGLGPWRSWHQSALFAVDRMNLNPNTRWDIGRLGKLLEGHNGWGYQKRGKHSPYLFAQSNHGVGVGKFVSDGRYDPRAVSRQVGAFVILHRLVTTGEWVTPAEPLGRERAALVIYDRRGEFISDSAAGYQEYLNTAREFVDKPFDELKVDGWAGKKTSTASKQVIGSYLRGDPRND